MADVAAYGLLGSAFALALLAYVKQRHRAEKIETERDRLDRKVTHLAGQLAKIGLKALNGPAPLKIRVCRGMRGRSDKWLPLVLNNHGHVVLMGTRLTKFTRQDDALRFADMTFKGHNIEVWELEED